MQQEGKTNVMRKRIDKQKRDRETKQRMLQKTFKKYKAPLPQISTTDIAEFRRARLEHKSASGKSLSAHTVNRDLDLISAVFKYARAEWGMDSLSNPVKGTKRPKVIDKRNILPHDWEMENIFAALDDYKPHVTWFKPMVLFQATVGLRAGETANIEPGDIDLKKRTIRLDENKTNYARDIPVCNKGIEVLKSFEWGNPRVFYVSSNQFSNEWTRFRKYLNERNLIDQDIRLHDLRHYALSQYFKLKTPDGFPALQLYHVQMISGHETLEVLLNTYVRKRDPQDVITILGF
jgi:integrase